MPREREREIEERKHGPLTYKSTKRTRVDLLRWNDFNVFFDSRKVTEAGMEYIIFKNRFLLHPFFRFPTFFLLD